MPNRDGIPAAGGGPSGGGGGSSPTVSQPRTCLLFRPGDPLGARENVFVDFAALEAQRALIQGCVAIAFDDQFVSPCVVPAAAYDMTDTAWISPFSPSGASTRVAVEVAAGATIANLTRIVNLQVALDGASGPIITPTAFFEAIHLDFATLTSLNGIPISIPAGFLWTAFLFNGGQFGTFPLSPPDPFPVATVALGAFAIVQGLSGGNSGQSVFAGDGDVFYGKFNASCLFGDSQPGLTGTIFPVSVSTKDQHLVVSPAVTGARIAAHNEFVPLDPTGGGFGQTLPPSDSTRAGMRITFKNITASANAVTIAPDGGGDSIIGDATIAAAQKQLVFTDRGDGTWASSA